MTILRVVKVIGTVWMIKSIGVTHVGVNQVVSLNGIPPMMVMFGRQHHLENTGCDTQEEDYQYGQWHCSCDGTHLSDTRPTYA